ncbi:Gfo/Idh/MocA family protein [endosymbiont of Ridgeia piscesae]|jgi:predicted dehydrogenase|uniref:Putative dehydrogenase n=1 Tax=endosymbiont of Ridgeia piscesae TaxID=54398 RepID=A0A0T5YT77_9GAMM|nr:Gfo/Idh/MocA family oxidoreductase [endosymbiont of Ridgeia piscesae]KRT53768.1 putative dehydrogenase [endosymbiont of Ridgeia piscesae]KRT57867.1 putative dehydrogenase [endosymbiont of Ridgeia piscesae]
MSERRRVGVVGVGYLGRFHALIYSRMPDVELVGVVDNDWERAQQVAEEAGCDALRDPGDLLERVDAVSVVVPTSLHLEIARPFLERGVAMLLEKPIASTVEQGAEIVRLAEASGALLQIGHLERFNAGVMALAERISKPRFIEAHRMGEFVARATDVDVVSDLMIHDIDIILSLVDSEISSIAAVGTRVLTSHIDIANARLEFVDGTVANVIASRVSEQTMRRIRVFAENRYESLDFVGQTIDTAYPQPKLGEAWPEIVKQRIQVEPVKPLDAELRAFIDSVRDGTPPLVDGRVGQKALEVAMQVKEKILNS